MQENKSILTLLTLSVIGISVFKLLFISLISPSADELYYWLWSKHLALGYPEHGPVIAFAMYLGTFFGDSSIFILRFWAVALFFLLALMMFFFGKVLVHKDDSAKLKEGNNWDDNKQDNGIGAGILFAVLILALPIFVGSSIIVTPDTPLAFFSFLAMQFYYSAFFRISVFRARRLQGKKLFGIWMLAGVFLGLAMLSKIPAGLLGLGFLAYVFLGKANEPKYWKPQILMAMFSFMLALGIFSLFIFWNWQNHWLFLKFLQGRLGERASWQSFLDFHYKMALLMFPVFYVLGCWLFIRVWMVKLLGMGSNVRTVRTVRNKLGQKAEQAEQAFFLCVVAMPSVMYFFITPFFVFVEVNWALVLFVPLTALVVLQVESHLLQLKTISMVSVAAILLLLSFSGLFIFFSDSKLRLPKFFTFDKSDFFYLFEVFEEEFPEYYERSMDKTLLIASVNYQIPAAINFYTRPLKEAVLIDLGNSYHLTLFDVIFHEETALGEDMYYVQPGKKMEIPKTLQESFASVKRLKIFSSKRRGKKLLQFTLFKGMEFKGTSKFRESLKK